MHSCLGVSTSSWKQQIKCPTLPETGSLKVGVTKGGSLQDSQGGFSSLACRRLSTHSHSRLPVFVSAHKPPPTQGQPSLGGGCEKHGAGGTAVRANLVHSLELQGRRCPSAHGCPPAGKAVGPGLSSIAAESAHPPEKESQPCSPPSSPLFPLRKPRYSQHPDVGSGPWRLHPCSAPSRALV